MKLSKKIALAIYFIALVLPIIGMMNCSGFDEGSMVVKSCVVDGSIFRAYASFYYGWLLIFAFAGFIPVLMYIGVVIIFAKIVSKIIDKFDQ